ncbi:bifunctional pyr operon transcriptional regulator/uracil phosphoribosyltransferase PyrR [Methylotenera sp. L2L1]|uniref:bifunctional pyr operon transcriptional regulator/uracil phosphoribosyltransferase PyrR n=1 Tax=Methylotenera sp. L2L1 TaxID=1502770 RepID=UPI000567F85D|nr:bifunctional pyr operon transcriptional regulator/uracil phosphoribosyltransferase PyrR [Methylotenera sp. L2L1]
MTDANTPLDNSQLPDAEQLLHTLAAKLKPLLKANTALVGIHSGGVWLMQRLLMLLDDAIKLHQIEHGTLDVSFYRDDYAQRGLKAENRPSQIPFEVENKHIILIDDVFYTGRTTRAAMNELFDYGRPASITLIALINRGGRELPITPQIVAADLSLNTSQHLQLTQLADGSLALDLTPQHNSARP